MGIKYLYIVRHGEAKHPNEDPNRGLTDQGRLEVERHAQILLEKKTVVSEVWHSTKLRAKETAEVIHNVAIPNARLEEKLGLSPNDPVENFEQDILSSNGNVMIVGHLPFVSYLVSYLVYGHKNFGEKVNWFFDGLFPI